MYYFVVPAPGHYGDPCHDCGGSGGLIKPAGT
jgi:hypothetical protein